MPSLAYLIKALLRRKHIEQSSLTQTRLDRCLSTLDLTALGIGSTLGLGIYVLAGEVASRTAGPAVTLSFLVAAVASVFAGLCYAEFGARVPKAGSAYVYSYVTVGELMAFIIGWNLVLEYVIGTASVARGYSGYIDSLVNGTIQRHFRDWMPMDVTGLSAYPDFLAFGITLLLTVMLAVGVKESTRFNSVFTVLNLLVVVFIVIAGSFKASIDNWKIPEAEAKANNAGVGGFMPFGFSGMMAGAATCFYGFIGFDVIATTGEEARNPQKSIPIGIVLSLLFVFLAYFGVSAVQTLMWPYYLQTEAITHGAPLPHVFEAVGMPIAKWIISIGALTGLSTSLLGAMFPLPRVLYSMASDGVIFRFLANVHPKFKTPLLATICSGVLAGGMAAMFDVKELADMMSIGTLLAYTLVAVSVMILRYSYSADRIGLSNSDAIVSDPQEVEPLKASPDNEYKEESQQPFPSSPDSDNSISSPNHFIGSSSDSNDNEVYTVKAALRQCFNIDRHTSPTRLSSKVSVALIITICALLVVFDSLLVALEDKIAAKDPASLVGIAIVFVVIIITIIALQSQPSSAKRISFQVPLVPWVPVLSVFVNFYLMLKLSTMTWIRFGVWMFIGFIQYFSYGIFESTGHLSDEEKARREGADISANNRRVCEDSEQQNINSVDENEPFLT